MNYEQYEDKADDQALNIINVVEALNTTVEKLGKAAAISDAAKLKTIKRFRQGIQAMLEDVPTQFRGKIEDMVNELGAKHGTADNTEA